MKKTWVYKRKNIKGWWCGWYEGGKRKAKALPIKALDEHFRNIIATRNRKVKKVMPERPIPEPMMTELFNYVATLPEGQEQLFADKFSAKRW